MESHSHTHKHGEAHHSHGHEGLFKSSGEAAAFIRYTLSHNAHHEEELSGLAHSLEHLGLSKEAGEVLLAIEDIRRADGRLKAVLDALK